MIDPLSIGVMFLEDDALSKRFGDIVLDYKYNMPELRNFAVCLRVHVGVLRMSIQDDNDSAVVVGGNELQLTLCLTHAVDENHPSVIKKISSQVKNWFFYSVLLKKIKNKTNFFLLKYSLRQQKLLFQNHQLLPLQLVFLKNL